MSLHTITICLRFLFFQILFSPFYRLTSAGSVFEDLGVIDEKGMLETYAGPFKLENIRYSDTEWFRRAIKSDFFISDVFLGLRGTPHFIITARQMSGFFSPKRQMSSGKRNCMWHP